MTKNCTLFITIILLFCFHRIHAQIHDGGPYDSTVFKFGPNDTIVYSKVPISIDTTGAKLWRIGSSLLKHNFYNKGNPINGIITDTANSYPVNANDMFILKLERRIRNTIVSFEHKYETRAGKDGGIVEYSVDTGKTWHNVKRGCNVDSFSFDIGLHTDNFYSLTDTLANGEPAFNGSTDTNWHYSRIQFFDGLPVKTTATHYECASRNYLYLRFRFSSDGNADTMSGWAIKRLVLEVDEYGGNVGKISNNNTLGVYPNPSADGIFYFPALRNEDKYRLQLINVTGKVLMDIPYTHQINTYKLSPGIYFYKVSGEDRLFTGRLLKE